MAFNPLLPLEEVKQCDEHEDITPNCLACQHELNQASARLTEQAQFAMGLGRDLARHAMQMPQDVMLAIRVETLINFMLGTGRTKMMFEAMSGAAIIEQMQQGLEQAQQGKGKLLVPKDKASGDHPGLIRVK